jgi:hypothetical protein
MPITVTAVVFQEGSFWIAQCLEYDIVSFAETLNALQHRLQEQLEAVVLMDKRDGLTPFTGFKRAPEKYWRMYEQLRSSVEPIKPKMSFSQRIKDWFAPSSVETLFIPAHV